MSKPFMCGDEPAIHIPGGGCDCNYTLIKVDDSDYYATYKLMLNGEQVGETITIPHDKVLVSGKVEMVTSPNTPYWGAEEGDYYLDLVIDHQQDHIYISLKELQGGGYIVVEDISDLPDPGDSRYIYLVPDGEGYAQYVWSDGAWVNIGSTNVNLDDYYTKTEVNDLLAQISLAAYPVGSIYMSLVETNPSTFFGGTWSRIQDRFLLAAGQTYSAGSTGGSATVTLTAAQMPSHRHQISDPKVITATTNTSRRLQTVEHSLRVDTNENTPYPYTDYAGSGQAHTNMPPYLTVYVWRRIV